MLGDAANSPSLTVRYADLAAPIPVLFNGIQLGLLDPLQNSAGFVQWSFAGTPFFAPSTTIYLVEPDRPSETSDILQFLASGGPVLPPAEGFGDMNFSFVSDLEGNLEPPPASGLGVFVETSAGSDLSQPGLSAPVFSDVSAPSTLPLVFCGQAALCCVGRWSVSGQPSREA